MYFNLYFICGIVTCKKRDSFIINSQLKGVTKQTLPQKNYILKFFPKNASETFVDHFCRHYIKRSLSSSVRVTVSFRASNTETI